MTNNETTTKMIAPEIILQQFYAARIIGFGPLRILTHGLPHLSVGPAQSKADR